MDVKQVRKISKRMARELKRAIKKEDWAEITRVTIIPKELLSDNVGKLYYIARNRAINEKNLDEVAQIPEFLIELLEKS